MSSTERRLIAEQGKIAALRDLIRQTAYMKASEVRAHLNMSRSTLAEIPAEVLPWVPGAGSERVERRYHPADVAAYPARARRWQEAKAADREAEVLEKMRSELVERDSSLIADALKGYAA